MKSLDVHTASLKPIPPFRLGLAAWTLRRRPENIVDRWDGQTYRRVLIFGGEPVEVAVVQHGPPEQARLSMTLSGKKVDASVMRAAKITVKRLLGVQADLSGFYEFAARDRRLGILTAPFRGMKPPRFTSVFEALINGIACQQLSLAAGIQILNRLCRAFGPSVKEVGAYGFPLPQNLASADPNHLRQLGLNRQKARAIIELSRAIAEGKLDLEKLGSLDDSEAIERLCRLRGVGRWTAEYALLRGMGRLHIFPGDDVGARNGLERWLKRRTLSSYEDVARALKKWKPWAGLIYFHMLLTGLANAGHLN